MRSLQSPPLTVNLKTAAESLGVSEATVTRLINTGVLPAKKQGGRILIRWADLEAHVDNLPEA